MLKTSTNSGYACYWQEDAGKNIKILDFRAEQHLSQSKGNMIEQGDTFFYNLELAFSSFLGLFGGGVQITINFSAQELTTGKVQPMYSKFMLKRHLGASFISMTEKRWDKDDPDFNFTAYVPGVFSLTTWVFVPSTTLVTYVQGPLLIVV